MNKIIFVLVLCLPVISAAETITTSGIDIKDLLNNTRAGVWLPINGGATFKTVYTPLIWLHSQSGMEYLSLDVGAAAPGPMTKGYAFVGLGFRIDNILNRTLNLSAWIKTHVGSATLPTLEAGIGPMLYKNKIPIGINVAVKF